jgi:hypothetical protein
MCDTLNTFKRMPSFFTSNYFSNWSQILKILIYTKFIFSFSQILYIKIQEVTFNMYFYCFCYSMSTYIIPSTHFQFVSMAYSQFGNLCFVWTLQGLICIAEHTMNLYQVHVLFLMKFLY